MARDLFKPHDLVIDQAHVNASTLVLNFRNVGQAQVTSLKGIYELDDEIMGVGVVQITNRQSGDLSISLNGAVDGFDSKCIRFVVGLGGSSVDVRSNEVTWQ